MLLLEYATFASVSFAGNQTRGNNAETNQKLGDDDRDPGRPGIFTCERAKPGIKGGKLVSESCS
ncbi:hypothetical protein BH20ACT23_BH20ACT23_05110 [soil metagenome]